MLLERNNYYFPERQNVTQEMEVRRKKFLGQCLRRKYK
jgi:hypothetical protein